MEGSSLEIVLSFIEYKMFAEKWLRKSYNLTFLIKRLIKKKQPLHKSKGCFVYLLRAKERSLRNKFQKKTNPGSKIAIPIAYKTSRL
jgi:hypothetical protein